MIADAADELITVSAELENARRSQRHSEALSKRNEILEKLLTRAAGAVATETALASRMGKPTTTPPGLSAALETLRQWRSQLDSDLPTALSGDAFPTFRTATEKAVGQTEAQAQTTWRTYVARTSPDIDTELLDVLSADPQIAVTVEQIGVLSNIVRGFAELELPTAEQVDQYDAMASDLQAAWSTIDLSSLDDELVAFLRAANGERGAALTTLTPPVLTWLAERGLTDHYVIRPNTSR